MVDRTLIDLVRRYLSKLDARGLPAPFGVVFGSTARGTTGDWSDIDLLVVSPRFDGRPVLRDVLLLWRVAAEKTGVAAVPGDAFFHDDSGEALVRFCYAKSKADLVVHTADIPAIDPQTWASRNTLHVSPLTPTLSPARGRGQGEGEDKLDQLASTDPACVSIDLLDADRSLSLAMRRLATDVRLLMISSG